jgi:hypothetical protein
MLTGVVPSQDSYTSNPPFERAGEIEFLEGSSAYKPAVPVVSYVVRPKIDSGILCEAGFQNNPEVHDFLIGPILPQFKPGPGADIPVSSAGAGVV